MALVIFDLDETLIHGDCSSLWSQRMASLGWVDESFLRRDAELMAQYAQGKLPMEDYMAFTLEPLVGRSVEEIEREVEAFVEEVIEPLIHSDACATLARHREAGDRPLVISASGVHLVQPIAARIGIDEVLAIDLEVLDGHYTGRTLGTLTYREGKVLRLLDLLEGDDRPPGRGALLLGLAQRPAAAEAGGPPARGECGPGPARACTEDGLGRSELEMTSCAEKGPLQRIALSIASPKRPFSPGSRRSPPPPCPAPGCSPAPRTPPRRRGPGRFAPAARGVSRRRTVARPSVPVRRSAAP